MGNNLSVLIDLHIILDVFQKRDPFFETSAGLLAAVESGQVTGYIAAHSITTLFYLIQKCRSASDARAIITSLLQFLKVLPVDQSKIEQALNLDYRDFEDAVLMISAVQNKLDCLITRISRTISHRSFRSCNQQISSARFPKIMKVFLSVLHKTL